MDERDNLDREREVEMRHEDVDSTAGDGEHHATTGGSAAAGAVTGGVIGLAGGPVGAAIGAIGGAIVGAAAERMMHSDDDAERARAGLGNDQDRNPLIEDRARADTASGATDFGTVGAPPTRPDYAPSSDRMQLREEQLEARKTSVETGQVTIGKDVIEERRTLEVPVTREEVVVERQAIDRRPTNEPIAETGRTIDVPVHREQVSVDKQPVVYEEVGIGKREVTDTQQVSGTVRREEARIENEGDVNVRGTDRPTSERGL